MPHQEILAVLGQRITDAKFLRLIARMLKAGVHTPGGVVQDELGSPQGSIVSPVVANVFLDTVLDQWFETVVTRHCRGYGAILRYADDTMALFEREDDAHRFLRVLPLRLGKFGLRLNTPKTHLLAFGKQGAWQRLRTGHRLPTVDFLGFTHYWGRSRNGLVRVKRKTSKKRLRRALRDLTQWLRQERHARKLPDLWQAMARKMRGHFNYFGVTDNSRALYRFERAVYKLLFKWGFEEQRDDNVTCAIKDLIAHPGLCNAARDWSPLQNPAGVPMRAKIIFLLKREKTFSRPGM